MKRFLVLAGLMAIGLASLASPQQQGPNIQTLAEKKVVSDRLTASLAEPFVGVRTSAGVTEGLFPIRATGVSTEPIRKAAAAFIASLTADQARRTVFDIEDPEWRTWLNVDNGIYVRQGTSLKEMTAQQRRLSRTLLRESLSARGLAMSDAIMKTDQSLREINNDIFSYDEGWYFFTMMGLPSHAWERFGIWLAIGLALYFAYGYKHSRLRIGGS